MLHEHSRYLHNEFDIRVGLLPSLGVVSVANLRYNLHCSIQYFFRPGRIGAVATAAHVCYQNSAVEVALIVSEVLTA